MRSFKQEDLAAFCIHVIWYAPLKVHDAIVIRVCQDSIPRAALHMRIIGAADLLLALLVHLHLQMDCHKVHGVNLEDLLRCYLDKLGVIDRAVFVLFEHRLGLGHCAAHHTSRV